MSTPEAEIKIDLDEIDAKKTEKSTPAPKTNDLRPQTDDVKVEKAEEAPKREEKQAVTPDAAFEKLQKQLDSEKAARIAAERRAQEAAEAEARARGETQTTQLDLLKNAIASVTSANDALEAQQAEAFAAQDFKLASKLNREMGVNSAKLIQLEAGKSALEKQPKPSPRVSDDPVERFTANMTPKSAAWVRAHPDYVTDADKNRAMIAAHELAMYRKLAPDSDEYFASVERTLELRKDADAPLENGALKADDPMADAAKPTARPAPPAAPVSRSGNGSGGRQGVVTLSSEQREAARLNGLTDEEYARNMVALKKEGRLN
jgi:hypothetical protein